MDVRFSIQHNPDRTVAVCPGVSFACASWLYPVSQVVRLPDALRLDRSAIPVRSLGHLMFSMLQVLVLIALALLSLLEAQLDMCQLPALTYVDMMTGERAGR